MVIGACEQGYGKDSSHDVTVDCGGVKNGEVEQAERVGDVCDEEDDANFYRDNPGVKMLCFKIKVKMGLA